MPTYRTNLKMSISTELSEPADAEMQIHDGVMQDLISDHTVKRDHFQYKIERENKTHPEGMVTTYYIHLKDYSALSGMLQNSVPLTEDDHKFVRESLVKMTMRMKTSQIPRALQAFDVIVASYNQAVTKAGFPSLALERINEHTKALERITGNHSPNDYCVQEYNKTPAEALQYAADVQKQLQAFQERNNPTQAPDSPTQRIIAAKQTGALITIRTQRT